MTRKLPSAGRALAVIGGALFLAGLLQGLVVDYFPNPRMALSAHLDAVQSGMAVMIAAAFWSSLRLTPALERVAWWALAVGMVGLWIGITLAAMTGASEALPMAGSGFAAKPVAETAVTTIVIGSSLALLLGWALFLWGLARVQ
jgi:(hydroxyamino)benzene mutase